jgi:hypothetical protein
MGAVIYLSREDKAVWIPAAIAMLGIAAPATNESGNSSVALKDQRGQTPLIISNPGMSVRGRGWPTEWPLSVEQLKGMEQEWALLQAGGLL